MAQKNGGFTLSFKNLPGNIIVFGWISFLTDFSSDMVYPLLPLFLTQYLHAGQGFVGLIEGVAESTAAFFTLLSGLWADRIKDRSKLVLAGYSLSSLSRPFLAIAWNPWVVLIVRFFDRVGKGIRTSPRDALIADSVSHEHRGRAYGLHRSFDHLGAVAGPLTAALLLSGAVTNFRILFAIAAVPGIGAVALILWKIREVLPAKRDLSSGVKAIRLPKGILGVYLSILFLFLLSCSSDSFLILRASQLGVAPLMIPVLWMLFGLIKSFLTYPFGILSDMIGRRKMILAGWIIYALVYVGFGLASETWHAWALFIGYAFFYGLTEGSERAILADYAGPSQKGQAFGWYYFTAGMAALPASLIFGWLWQTQGSSRAFFISAAVSAGAAVLLFLFLFLSPSKKKTHLPIASDIEMD